jgi:pimeloyl-ACP methyl ester carboxylesterase
LISYTTHLHHTSTNWVTFVHGAGGSSTIWHKQLRDFKEHYNLLLLDLRGHGNYDFQTNEVTKKNYTFDSITNDILEVLDAEKIEKSHFIGISLGTILIRNLAKHHPKRVKSMIMGGAIMKLNFRSQLLIKLGVTLKSVVPYLWLYQFFAFIIMPNNNHTESRKLFVQEAKKLNQKEFIRWFKLASEVNKILRYFRTTDISIPTLYVMGAEDYLFLPSIKKISAQHNYSKLVVIQNCGHVVNVDQAKIFNDTVLDYVQSKN